MQILHKAIHNIRGGMRISDIGFLIETEAPVVDLVLFSDKVDMRRALFSEKKILDLKPVQMDDVGFIWIHLVGYDRPIKYAY